MAKSTIDKILDTAEKIVAKHGAVSLTLDRVAKEGKLSKGGVLYHFPSKEKLLSALVARLLDRFDELLQKNLERYDGDFTEAYVQTCLHDPSERSYHGLLAAVANDPLLLAPLRKKYAEWQHELNRSSDPVRGALVRLCLDGIWISQSLNLPLPDDKTLKQLFKRL